MARLPEFKPHILGINYTSADIRHYVKNDAQREREIRKEYQRLRKITQRRIERLSRSEFQFSKAGLIGRSLNKKLKVGKELGIKAISTRIQEMNDFLNMRTSTIKGAREVRRETRENVEEAIDYKFKNNKEFELFTQFMDYIRAKYKDNFHYLVDEVVDLFSDYSTEVLNNSMTFNEFVEMYDTKYKSTPQPLKRPTKYR